MVPEKRIKALTAFLQCVRDKYAIHPRFVHTDKDMAEIKASKTVWVDAKHQLCWWHLRRAIRQRLALAKLETSDYNAQRANQVFDFIDATWYPARQADPADNEGDVADGEGDVDAIRIEDTNVIPAIKLTRPLPTQDKSANTDSDEEGEEDSETEEEEDEETEDNPDDDDYTERARKPRKLRKKRKARKCQAKKNRNANGKKTKSERTFCPAEYREEIVALVERHLCAHPLIPDNHGGNPKAIHYWATKKIYQYCVDNELVEVWAYLWVNWYRPSRWRLWARAESSEIPRLKTTMVCESQ
jgi:MULE transposase domain